MAAGVLFEKLVQLIESNSDSVGAVLRDNPCKFRKNIDTLKAFMQEYLQGSKDDIAERLVNKIRDLVSGAENDIDSFITYANHYKQGRFPRRLPDEIARMAVDVRGAVKIIETLTELVQKYQNKEELDFDSFIIQLPDRSPERNMALMVEDKVVGFDNQLEEVIQLLCGGSDQLDVISITGKAGLGKTTLAKMVFNHPRIQNEFVSRSFVTVPPEYSQKEMLLKIIGDNSQLTSEVTCMSDSRLGKELRELLSTKTYLIILDGVRHREDCDYLKVAFPNNKKRCRVLITSQDNAADWQANPKINQYFLRSLNTYESQELLRREVFGDNNCPLELEEYELQILQKCNGVPLAVLLVAGILLNDRDEIKWWKKVAELVNDQVAVDPTRSILDMVRLSFNQLPARLKRCFLYLGTFREYFQIPVWKLLRLWIAEGFVQQDENLSLEDIADGYLEDLIHRNLVMVGQKRANGQIKTGHIHPTVGEFCKKQGAKENLFKEINKRSETSFLLNNCHRLCINSNSREYLTSSGASSHKSILSFLCFDHEDTFLPIDMVSSFAKSFKILRVLDVRPINFTRFPPELFTLVHLKYLAISCNFKVLPKTLSCLSNLQTLIVETLSRTLEIEANILMMAQLRHLHTNASTHLKDGEEETFINASLQTLSTISAENFKEKVLERTPNLKKLGVRGKLGILPYWPDIISKLGIQNLKLLNDDITCRLHFLPRETNFPSKLRKLTMLNTLLEWKHIVTLGKLVNLEVLKLKDNAFQGELWKTEDGGFRCLKVLHIGSTNLVIWRASASHFPMLTSLFLRHCSRLEAIPGDFANISSLQKIELYCTNPLVASSARKIQLSRLRTSKISAIEVSVFPPDQ